MTRQSAINTLKAMRFRAIAEEFERQLSDPQSYTPLAFEDRIGLMVDAVLNRRRANKHKRLVNAAHFSLPSTTVEGIEYYEDRKLDKAADRQVLHMPVYLKRTPHHSERHVRERKTYIACALGNAACRKYFKTGFCLKSTMQFS